MEGCPAGLERHCNRRVSLADVGIPEFSFCPDWCRLDRRGLKELEARLDGAALYNVHAPKLNKTRRYSI